MPEMLKSRWQRATWRASGRRSAGDASAASSDSLNTSDERHATTDVCEIIITESDSSSEKLAKEFALTLSKRLTADDVESGYGSALCTPAPSRLASYAQLPQLPDFYPPAPSRLPSYGRLELISEAEAATTSEIDTQNSGDTDDTS